MKNDRKKKISKGIFIQIEVNTFDIQVENELEYFRLVNKDLGLNHLFWLLNCSRAFLGFIAKWLGLVFLGHIMLTLTLYILVVQNVDAVRFKSIFLIIIFKCFVNYNN